MDSFFWIIVVAFVVIGILFAVIGNIRENKRTQAWQELAQQPGMTFLGESSDFLSRYGHLKLFQTGRSRKVRNMVAVESGEVRVMVGDFSYRTGSGKNSSTHRRTICVLESATLNVPPCNLRPEIRLLDALGSVFGGQDIDFAEDPQFSQAYVLQGDDESAVRELFAADVRAWFCERISKRLHFEAQRNTLVFHTGDRRPPTDAPSMMDQALQIVKLLSRTAS